MSCIFNSFGLKPWVSVNASSDLNVRYWILSNILNSHIRSSLFMMQFDNVFINFSCKRNIAHITCKSVLFFLFRVPFWSILISWTYFVEVPASTLPKCSYRPVSLVKFDYGYVRGSFVGLAYSSILFPWAVKTFPIVCQFPTFPTESMPSICKPSKSPHPQR